MAACRPHADLGHGSHGRCLFVQNVAPGSSRLLNIEIVVAHTAVTKLQRQERLRTEQRSLSEVDQNSITVKPDRQCGCFFAIDAEQITRSRLRANGEKAPALKHP